MPTTIDRFFSVVQICQNLATMQNNMRANVQIIQAAKNAGTIATFAAAQQATRDLGNAFLSRLSRNQTIMTNFPSQLSAGSTAVGITPSDVTDLQALLVTWATNLSTAVITNQTQLDNGVTAVLANVPAAMLPF